MMRRMARGIVLGGRTDIKPRIFLPDSCSDIAGPGPLVGKCLAPGCGAVFYSGQEDEWQAHTARCGRAKLDEIRALAPSEKNKGTIFADHDVELERHFRRVRERMERDGDMTVHPHERAGL